MSETKKRVFAFMCSIMMIFTGLGGFAGAVVLGLYGSGYFSQEDKNPNQNPNTPSKNPDEDSSSDPFDNTNSGNENTGSGNDKNDENENTGSGSTGGTTGGNSGNNEDDTDDGTIKYSLNDYELLDYIESTGTQYIDTGYTPNSNTRVLMSAKTNYVGSGSSCNFFFGAAKNYFDTAFECYTYETRLVRYYNKQEEYTTFNSSVPITIDFNKNVCQINLNGTISTSTFTAGAFTCPTTMYIFYLNRQEQPNLGAYSPGFTLYSCKIWNNDTLVRYLVPAMNFRGEAGLLDLVNKKFYGNEGTGEFKFGKKISTVDDSYTTTDYIQSTGTQYIDTGIVPTNHRTVISAQYTTNKESSLFGAWRDTSTAMSVYEITWHNSQWFYGVGTIENNGGADYVCTDKHTYDYNNSGKFYIDGNLISSSIASSMSFSSTDTMWLFAKNRSIDVGTTWFSPSRIYSCKIYDNTTGTLVRDFVPVVSSSGKAGMFDRVTNSFFANAGTGEFITSGISGYELLDYIESTGTQYIDTGFYAKPTTRIYADIQFTDLITQQRVFGNGDSDYAPLMFETYINGLRNWAFAYQDNEGNWINSGISANTNRHTFDLDGKNKTFKIDNGSTYSASLSSYTATKTATKTTFLLGRHSPIKDANDSHLASAKLYGAKIWDNGTLVRYFVPAKNINGEVGLLDLVEHKFYGNAGTGTFTYGKKLSTFVNSHTEVEYIQATGSQFVNTGIYANPNTHAFMDMQFTELHNQQRVFGGAPSNSGQILFEIYVNGEGNWAYQYQDQSMDWQDATTGVSANTNRHTFDLDGKNKTFKIDDGSTVSVSLAPRTATITNTTPLFLLARYSSADSARDGAGMARAKLYGAKLWDNGILVRDFVPAVTSSGKAGLYDKVTGSFFASAGDTDFLAPKTEENPIDKIGSWYQEWKENYNPDTTTNLKIGNGIYDPNNLIQDRTIDMNSANHYDNGTNNVVFDCDTQTYTITTQRFDQDPYSNLDHYVNLVEGKKYQMRATVKNEDDLEVLGLSVYMNDSEATHFDLSSDWLTFVAPSTSKYKLRFDNDTGVKKLFVTDFIIREYVTEDNLVEGTKVDSAGWINNGMDMMTYSAANRAFTLKVTSPGDPYSYSDKQTAWLEEGVEYVVHADFPNDCDVDMVYGIRLWGSVKGVSLTNGGWSTFTVDKTGTYNLRFDVEGDGGASWNGISFTLNNLCIRKKTSAFTYWWQSRASSFAGGDGTVSNPYQIATAEQLALLSWNTSYNVSETTLAAYCGAYYKLTADIDLSAHLWNPIGFHPTYKFYGTFDGNGHTISGMNCTLSSSQDPMYYDGTTYTRMGLFSTLEYSTSASRAAYVHDLIISNSLVNSDIYYIESLDIGILTGVVGGSVTQRVEISNVGIINSLMKLSHSKKNIGGSNCGGFIGWARYCEISSCFVMTSDIYNNITSIDNACVGGFIGYIDCGVAIQDCYYTGNFVSLTSIRFLGGFIAAIAGAAGNDNKVSIDRCYVHNQNIVEGTFHGGVQAGGFIGYIHEHTDVYCCFAHSEITVTASENAAQFLSNAGDGSTVYIVGDVCYNPNSKTVTNCSGAWIQTYTSKSLPISLTGNDFYLSTTYLYNDAYVQHSWKGKIFAGDTSDDTSYTWIKYVNHDTKINYGLPVHSWWAYPDVELTIKFVGVGTTVPTLHAVVDGEDMNGNSVSYVDVANGESVKVKMKYSSTQISLPFTLTTESANSNSYYISVGEAASTNSLALGFNNSTSSTNGYSHSWTPNQDGEIVVYVAQRYTIDYNGNGETSGVVPATQYKMHGGTDVILHNNETYNLQKSGYELLGWNTVYDGSGEGYGLGETYTGNADLMLYAHWKALEKNMEINIRTITESGAASTNVFGNSVVVEGYLKDETFTTTCTSSTTTIKFNPNEKYILTAECADGYAFFGFTTNANVPTGLMEAPDNPIDKMDANTDDKTVVYYAWFKYVGNNKIKKDNWFGTYYFESGEYPQTYLGEDISGKLENVKSGLTYLYSINYLDKNGEEQSVDIYEQSAGVYLDTNKTCAEVVTSYLNEKYTNGLIPYEPTKPITKYARAVIGSTAAAWFAVEPIRWQVNENLFIDEYGHTEKNTLGVTTQVIAFGRMDTSYGFGFDYSDSKLYSQIKAASANVYANTTGLQDVASVAYANDVYNNGGASSVVGKGNPTDYTGFVIASNKEILQICGQDSTMSKCSDLVAFILSGGKKTQAYWERYCTRSFGTAVGSVYGFHEAGMGKQYKMNDIYGYRLTLTLSQTTYVGKEEK